MTILGDPAAGDRGRYRVAPVHGATAFFEADFQSFTFPPHFHDTLMLGLILEGEKRFSRGRAANRVGRGGLSVVNPGDMHTGGVVRGGARLRYVAVYPEPALLAEAGLPAAADFPKAVIEDPRLAALFARALSWDAAPETVEETLLMALSALGARHGATHEPPPAACPRTLRLAIDHIEARLETPLRLPDIAAAAKVGARHLIRCFRQYLGVTPLDYVRQARVRAAAGLLRRGLSAVEAAAAAGFADQPHLTRTFRAVMGVTPAAFAASWRGGCEGDPSAHVALS